MKSIYKETFITFQYENSEEKDRHIQQMFLMFGARVVEENNLYVTFRIEEKNLTSEIEDAWRTIQIIE